MLQAQYRAVALAAQEAVLLAPQPIDAAPTRGIQRAQRDPQFLFLRSYNTSSNFGSLLDRIPGEEGEGGGEGGISRRLAVAHSMRIKTHWLKMQFWGILGYSALLVYQK